MNKSDLINLVAVHSDRTKADADQAIEAVFAAITVALKAGDAVRLAGFGSFSVTSRPARLGRNPRTGESVSVPASKAPKFSVGKALKEALNT